MRPAIGLLIFLVSAMFSAPPLPWSFLRSVAMAQDRVIQVPVDDKEMQDAMTAARKSLDAFWKAFEANQPGDEGFALKVAVIEGQRSSISGSTGSNERDP